MGVPPGVTSVAMFAGTSRTGGPFHHADDEAPVAGVASRSVAVQVTGMAPTRNVEPLTGVHEGVNVPSTLSWRSR